MQGVPTLLEAPYNCVGTCRPSTHGRSEAGNPGRSQYEGSKPIMMSGASSFFLPPMFEFGLGGVGDGV